MLQKLYIQNYAIIDEININFSKNLNVITGETGAGKSILMGAVSLILGERAETASLRDNNKKCIVEGHFFTTNNLIKSFLSTNELDNGEELILRREIAANGKSRAFINDTPVNLNQLKELSSLLVDLHQQFDTLELGDRNFQREILDALAGNGVLLADFKQNFAFYLDKKNQLNILKKTAAGSQFNPGL
jgi:DNA repair protein RecN (Recombination protein N)